MLLLQSHSIQSEASVRHQLPKSITLLALVLALTLCQVPMLQSADKASSPERAALIPQHLLGLVHAPEVHQELGLSPSEVAKLETLFSKVDGTWFRARILPADQQRRTIASLEDQVWKWFSENASAEQVKRLQQLERRALAVRMFLRSDMISALSLTEQQQSEFEGLAKTTDKLNAELQKATMSNSATEDQRSQAAQAAKAELDAVQRVLEPEQLKLLSDLMGQPFDPSKLARIYPLAPELQSVTDWINSKPLTIESLRGKVVVVHFYAFQCHNCHANFEHYKKWSSKWGDDVVVIGIQTPETSAESDPVKVRAAAKERSCDFPVLVDLERKNWDAWANTMWPTVYVVDQDGYLRHWWQGELNWNGATGDQTIEKIVDTLLEDS